jgi:protein O-GlcNAc transferase
MREKFKPAKYDKRGDLATFHHFQRAFGLHQKGRLEKAESLYRQVPKTSPHHCEALYQLGVIAVQRGDWTLAVTQILEAIKYNSNNPTYHGSLGWAYHCCGRYNDAIKSYQTALSFNPRLAAVYVNLGNALIADGKVEAAIKSYRSAITTDASLVEAHFNLANALKTKGDFDEAIQFYRKALACRSDFIEAHYNLANTLLALDRHDEAISHYQTCLAYKADWSEACINLGIALINNGQIEAAIASYEKAIRPNRSSPEAFNNLGNALLSTGRRKEAKSCFQRALSIKPDYAEAQFNRGHIYLEEGQTRMSIRCFRTAIELKHDFAEAFNYLGIAYSRNNQSIAAVDCFKKAITLKPDYIEAQGYLVHHLQSLCDWQPLQEAEVLLDRMEQRIWSRNDEFIEAPFIHISRCTDLRRNLKVARSCSRAIEKSLKPYRRFFLKDARREKTSKITVGYLSSDFYDHATAHLMRGVFELHDRRHFVIDAYSYGPDDGSHYRQHIAHHADRFFDIRHQSHLEAARLIHDNGVDILVDLKGHTRGGRLAICALRPAPVNVAYLGFPGTSGADFIDYLITDRIVTPPRHQRYYSEKFVYLPDSYQVNDNRQVISSRRFTKADFGIPSDHILYCSFNQSYKIDPKMFECWMRILAQTPKSSLWLFSGGEICERALKSEAEKRGVSPDRLIFADKWPKSEHLARLAIADLALDTRIVNGHTTTSDSLWAGVPVIALLGEHFASRVSASLLTAIGLPELISENLDEYEHLAVRLAQNPKSLFNLRQKLNTNRATRPLFDTVRFVANLEKAYSAIWRLHEKGRTAQIINL